MKVHRRLAVGVVAGALVFAAVGCGGGGSGGIGKKTITDGKGNKISVNANNGKYTATDANGNTFSVDANGTDGQYTATDSNGNVVTGGTGASLPDGWPSDLAPPDSVKIMSSSTSTQDGKQQFFVVGQTSTSFDDIYNGLKTQLKNAGYTIAGDTKSNSGDGAYASIQASNDTYDAGVAIATSTSDNMTTVTFTLSAKS